MSWNPGKSLKKIGKSFKKLTSGKGLMTMAMYVGGAALMATGIGAPMGAMMIGGAAVGAAATGAFGHTAGDIATLGANAQVRANQRLANIYNRAQQEQSAAIAEQNRRSLVQSIRAQRIARSLNLADYATETSVTSSGALGNLSSIGSQYLSNTDFAVRQGQHQNRIQTIMNEYNKYQAKAQNKQIMWNNWKSVLRLGMSVYGSGAGAGDDEELPTYEGIDFSISPGSKK